MSDETSARRARRARSKKRRRNKKAPEETEAAAGDGSSSVDATDEEGDDDAPSKRPAKKRKRKRRRRAARPPFARDYPDDPALDALLKAFEEGNFAEVRRGAPALVEGEVDERVQRAARDLRRRIDPAPTSVYLWAIGLCLLVFLYGYYLSHT